MRIALAIPLLALALNGQSPGYLISTLAGSGWIGDGGPATQAILRQPGGIAADAAGNIYIAETGGNRVRKMDRSGAITTLAGTGVAGFSGDGGPAAQAQLTSPYGVAVDIFGNVYIADLGNARVRRVGLDGKVLTVAGGGTRDSSPANEGLPGVSMRLLAPRNLLVDDQRNLYISDFAGHRVFKLSPDGLLTTVAGTGAPGYSGDGGAASTAQLAFPAGLAMAFDGSLYIADSANHAVRRISKGVITRFAWAGTPVGLALDVMATLYVTDTEAGRVLRFPVSGALPPLDISASDVARAPDL
jgi:trimeric autotransporter adhesin